MPRRRSEKHGVAPYTKYEKTPYRYRYPHCEHKSVAAQSVTTDMGRWSGVVCATCGIIISNGAVARGGYHAY